MPRYWVVRMRMSSEEDSTPDWEIATKSERPFVGIGWPRIGDLTRFSEDNKELLIEKLEEAYKEQNNPNRTFINWASYILTFVNRIDVNDIVILPTYPDNDKAVYFVGRVDSSAYYVESPRSTIADVHRDVKWLGKIEHEKTSAQFKGSLGNSGTVFNIDKHEREIESLLKTTI